MILQDSKFKWLPNIGKACVKPSLDAALEAARTQEALNACTIQLKRNNIAFTSVHPTIQPVGSKTCPGKFEYHMECKYLKNPNTKEGFSEPVSNKCFILLVIVLAIYLWTKAK